MKGTLPEPQIARHKGKSFSAILRMKDYEEPLERVEDAHDVAWLKRARKKPLHYRPLKEYLANPSSHSRLWRREAPGGASPAADGRVFRWQNNSPHQ